MRKLKLLWLRHRALAHYRRMIKWAQTQPPQACAACDDMLVAIGETWSSDDCCYCQALYSHDFDCDACPLTTTGRCCDGLYKRMANTSTWDKWIAAAEDVCAYIKEHGAVERER